MGLDDKIYLVIGQDDDGYDVVVDCAMDTNGLLTSFKVKQWKALYPKSTFAIKEYWVFG